jgi:hypothetical protein
MMYRFYFTYTVRVVNSLLKTKHKAVTARADEEINIGSSRITAFVYDKRQHNIDYLRHTMATFDWTALNNSSNITEMYSQFVTAVSELIDQCIPKKAVHLGPRDPEYFTPLIKQLLIRRNRFMHRGKLARANELSLKLNMLIKEARSQHMSSLANADTKQLWQAVSGKRGNGQDNICSNIGTVDQFNKYFANVATDPDYNKQDIEKLIEPTPADFDYVGSRTF